MIGSVIGINLIMTKRDCIVNGKSYWYNSQFWVHVHCMLRHCTLGHNMLTLVAEIVVRNESSSSVISRKKWSYKEAFKLFHMYWHINGEYWVVFWHQLISVNINTCISDYWSIDKSHDDGTLLCLSVCMSLHLIHIHVKWSTFEHSQLYYM